MDFWYAELQKQAHVSYEIAEEKGVPAGRLIHPTRLAVTGLAVSPGIFEVLEVLGRERSLRRMERMIRHLGERPKP